MQKKIMQTGMVLVFTFFIAATVQAHCQMPCGIYDDGLRLAMISEDVKTIEKSMNQILDLEKAKNKNYNQLVRWIDTKDDHAKKIQGIVCQYFLPQRLNFDDKDYVKKLTLLHKILVYAMKCKQTVELENLNKLRAACRDFEAFYH